MRHLSFRPPLDADVAQIASRMRQYDQIEARAHGLSPTDALRLGAASSLECYTALVDGEPEAMFGVSPASLLDGIGQPWLLASDRAYDCGRAWVRIAPLFIARFARRFPRMENHVHAENHRAKRVIRALGFDIAPEAVQIGGEPMLKFSRGF